MKRIIKISLFFVLLAVLLIPSTALAAGADSELNDEYVLGENFTLESGEVLDEDLFIFGGNVDLEEGSVVEGDIWLTGGNLVVDGEVEGNIRATGGTVDLGDTAVVGGDIQVLGATLSQEPGATIEGEVERDAPGPFRFSPRSWDIPVIGRNAFSPLADFIRNVLGVIFGSALLAALAIVVVMFWPRYVDRISNTVVAQPVISGGLGLLTIFVSIFVLGLLAITIILSPISLLGGIILVVLVTLGWIAVGYELGKRLETAFKAEWSIPVTAGLGTLMLSLIANGLTAIPFLNCITWIIPFVIGTVGLGAVLLTRIGTQSYPPETGAFVTPIIPPTAPAPPTAPTTPESGAMAYPVDEDIPPAA